MFKDSINLNIRLWTFLYKTTKAELKLILWPVENNGHLSCNLIRTLDFVCFCMFTLPNLQIMTSFPYVCVATYTIKLANTWGCDVIIFVPFRFFVKHESCFFFNNDLCYVVLFVKNWFRPLFQLKVIWLTSEQ